MHTIIISIWTKFNAQVKIFPPIFTFHLGEYYFRPNHIGP